MKRLLSTFAAVGMLAGLFAAGPALALPICELDCNINSPCDQFCYVMGGGTSQTSTCAAYICDEPQFPWPLASFEQTLAELETVEGEPVENKAGSGTSSVAATAEVDE